MRYKYVAGTYYNSQFEMFYTPSLVGSYHYFKKIRAELLVQLISAPRAVAQITEVTADKEIKYREYWWQFWRPVVP